MGIKSFVAGVAVGAAVMAIYDGRVKLPTELKLPSISFTNPWAEPPLPAEVRNTPKAASAPEIQAPVEDKSAEAVFRACYAEATGIQERLKMKIERSADNRIISMTYSGGIDGPKLADRIWKNAPVSTTKSRTFLWYNADASGVGVTFQTEWENTSAKASLITRHNEILPATLEPGKDYKLSMSSETGIAPPSANRPALESMLLKVMECGQQYNADAH